MLTDRSPELSSGAQIPVAEAHDPDLFSRLCADLECAFKALHCLNPVFNLPTFSAVPAPCRIPVSVLRIVEDMSDSAIFSINNLVNRLSDVVGLELNNINLSVTDIRYRAADLGLTLTLEFDHFCSSLSADSGTPEAVAKLATAHALCALYDVYRVADHARMACDVATQFVADLGRVGGPSKVARAQAAADKATCTTLIAAFAAHLTAAFAAERLAEWYAIHTRVTQDHALAPVCAVAAHASAVAAKFAADTFGNAVANAAASVLVFPADVTLARAVALTAFAAAARSDAVVARSDAVDTNKAVWDALDGALACATTDEPLLTLSLAVAARAAHRTRVSSSSSTSSA